jgi:hypothetical protein
VAERKKRMTHSVGKRKKEILFGSNTHTKQAFILNNIFQ